MSPFSSRPGRPRTGGQTVVAVALFSLVALVIGLAVHARAAERSQRRTADRALRDYAAVATWQYVRHADDALHGAAAASLVPSMGHLMARPGTKLPPPSRLLEVDTTVVTCWIAKRAKSAFFVDLRTGRIEVAGEDLGDATRDALPARVARIVNSTTTNTDPHRLAVDTIGGVERVISLALVRDSARVVWGAYGVDAPPNALDTLFHEVAQKHELLPHALVGDIPNDRVIAVRVARADGLPFFERGKVDERYAATDTMSVDQGSLIVTVSLEPRLASSLIIGGLPPSRLPALLALLVLSILLTLLAFAQLRRSRELARLRNQFVANVSHELRTPLAQISMFSETLLLGRERSTDERRHFLSVIFRETRRLASLVESVLRFSRGEAGATRLRPEPYDVSAEARETLATFAPLASAAGALLRPQLDEGAFAMVDPGALRQIVLNLLDNAVKYGPERQTIVVRVVRGGDEVVISVDDEGPGIPPSDRRRVFDPFERLDRRGAPKTSGAGIGLAVVRDLVIAHAGRVWIEDAPTGGARVSIALRAVEAPQRGEPRSRTLPLEEATSLTP
jgi:signal transduction histidine kinase